VRQKAQRAVALVLKAVALGAARRERQHPVFAVQRLDRGLLVHAEHHRVRGRVQVQADHVGGLGLEVRIVRDHVPLEPVRSYAVLAPDALHRGKRHVAQLRGELAAAPVGRSVGRSALERVVQYPRLELCRGLLRCPTGIARVHPRKSLFQKPTRPARDEARVALEPTHDRVARVAVFEHQNQFGSSNVSGLHRARSRHGQQLILFNGGQAHFSHAPIEAQKGCALNASAD